MGVPPVCVLRGVRARVADHLLTHTLPADAVSSTQEEEDEHLNVRAEFVSQLETKETKAAPAENDPDPREDTPDRAPEVLL